MALKLLQGPITCTADPFDSDYTTPVSFGVDSWVWMDEYGAVGNPHDPGIGLGGNVWGVMNMDGVMFIRKNTYGSGSGGYGNIAYDYIANLPISWTANSVDRPHHIKPLTGWTQEDIHLPTPDNNRAAIRLPDRWLDWETGGDDLESAPLTDAGAFAAEYTLSPAPTLSAGARFSRGRGDIVYFWTGNEIISYDWVKLEEVLPRKIPSVIVDKGIAYSPRFDIFIGFNETGTADQDEMYIWANEFEISALSAPTDLTPITQGRVSTIQTTLTDSDGTGIPDRLVDWSITVGNGTLSATQTVTDADGVAEVDYRAELSGGVNPTIQASVTY